MNSSHRTNVTWQSVYDIVGQGEIESVSWVGVSEAIRTVSITMVAKTLATGRASFVNVQ